MDPNIESGLNDRQPDRSQSGQSQPVVPKRHRLNLEETQQLFEFLQGKVPEGYKIASERAPNLTDAQAWTAIWYLGNLYMQVSDVIERCEVCGSLYNSEADGTCLDFGTAPYHFCGSCEYSHEYSEKVKQCPNDFHKSPIDGDSCSECLEMYESTS